MTARARCRGPGRRRPLLHAASSRPRPALGVCFEPNDGVAVLEVQIANRDSTHAGRTTVTEGAVLPDRSAHASVDLAFRPKSLSGIEPRSTTGGCGDLPVSSWVSSSSCRSRAPPTVTLISAARAGPRRLLTTTTTTIPVTLTTTKNLILIFTFCSYLCFVYVQ